MSCNFQEFEITEHQEKWLKEVYKYFKNFEEPRYETLKADLVDEIPNDFNPREIDQRLLYGDRHITPIGIEQLDPDNNYLDQIDKIVSSIYDYLKGDPETLSIMSNDIVERSKLDEELVCWLIKYIQTIFRLFQTVTGGNENDEMEIKFSGDTFDLIWNYPGICKFTKEYYQEKEKSAKREGFTSEILQSPSRQNNDFNNSSIRVNPIFQSKVTRIDENMCFVIMPFEEDWSDRVYNQLIKEYIEQSLGIQCVRADNLHGPIIMEDIWVKINQSAFVVADVTGKNPNVMYELGIVHSIGKPSILITQDTGEIPFDTKYLRHYEYEDVGGGFDKLGNTFRERVEKIYNDHYEGITFPE